MSNETAFLCFLFAGIVALLASDALYPSSFDAW